MLCYNDTGPSFPKCQKLFIACCQVQERQISALVLLEYGGIYTAFDSAPNNLLQNGSAIADTDESLFVVECGGWLSQYFMAASPHHPLMYLVIQKRIQRLYTLNDVDRQYVSRSTGPGSLKYASIAFMNDQGDNFYEGFGNCNSDRDFKYGHFTAGHYIGWVNRTVTVVGDRGHSDDYVHRDSIKAKGGLYQQMNMTHFSSRVKIQEVESCFRRIYVRDELSKRHPQTTFNLMIDSKITRKAK